MANKVHAVGVIFENEKGEILVLRRDVRSIEGNRWGLVGGNVDEGEKPKMAAAREVREEIGQSIDINNLRHIKTYQWAQDDIDVKFEVYKLHPAINNLKVTLDLNENTEHDWALPNELYKRHDLMRGLYPILEDEYKPTASSNDRG